MKLKRICSVWVAATIFAFSLTVPAFASEQQIYKADFTTEFSNSNNNGWSEVNKDGSLVLYPKPNTASGKECYSDSSSISYNRNLPKNTEMTVSVDFTMADKPKSAGEQIWFRLDTPNSSIPVFCISSEPGKNLTMGYCSTTSWPFTAKALDRDPNSLTSAFEYGKSYTVDITFKPNATNPDASRVVVRAYNESSEIGAAIIDEYTKINNDFIKNIKTFVIAQVIKATTKEIEPVVIINDINISASYTDEPLSYTTFPTDGQADVYTGTSAYIEFDSPIENISYGDVEIVGGINDPAITNIELSPNSKKLTFYFDSLEPNTDYTITAKNVCAADAKESFTYKWAFTTGSTVKFGTPYMLMGSKYEQVFSDFDISQVAGLSDSSYLNGEAWASNHSIIKSGDKSTDVCVDAFGITSDGYLGIYRDFDTSLGNASWHRISRKINPITYGNTLKISGVVDVSGYNGYNYSFIAFNLGDGAALDGKEDKTAKNIAILERAGSWTSNFGTLAKNRYNFNGDRNVTDSTSSVSGQTIELGASSGSYIGDTNFEFTLEPSKDDNGIYIAKTVFNGNTYRLEIPTEEVLTYDTLSFTSGRNSSTQKSTETSEHSKAFMKFREIAIEEIPTSTSLDVGTNKLYIPYENSNISYPAQVMLLIVERLPDGDSYGQIVNVTVKKLDEFDEEDGICTAEFEITEAGTVADVYIIYNLGNMQLVADNISLYQKN